MIKPQSVTLAIDSSQWSILLKNHKGLNVFTEYIKYGVMNRDKTMNPSSQEIVAWIKQIFWVKKTEHSGTLDPKIINNLIVCIDKATHLYVCVAILHSKVLGVVKVTRSLETLTGALRIRTIYEGKLLEYDANRHLVVLWISCEPGSYVRTMLRFDILREKDKIVTMHDVLDAQWVYDNYRDEILLVSLFSIFLCVNVLLTSFKRLVVKDSAMNAICYRVKLMIPELLRFENDIEVGEEVVLMSRKYEAIALGIVEMTISVMDTYDHGVVANTKRTSMKKLIAEGNLDKHGKPNENTPKEWMDNVVLTIRKDYVVASLSIGFESTIEAKETVEAKKKKKGGDVEDKGGTQAQS
ncbi:hypothetical protein K2173_016722 [Erythroxylum novogranatense]|uniref:Uncharacterized protein n=1 Tax=Erythroxylum novogranatense TaxID=1862640 RepID=A0AAV8SH69_9ROSI|nr:hypothetical protein K2173_016722 [Erythroxylum novogranatense]